MFQNFSADNSNLSAMMRTQGEILNILKFTCMTGSTYFCWAFSCASTLRSACSILIKKLFEAGKIDEETKSQCLWYINNEENHRKIRNLIAMILVPKKIHKDDSSQAAFLRAAVSRVSSYTKNILHNLRLPIQQYLKKKVH